MRILITGPQGSGKTTHARIVSEKFELCFVKTGDLVRAKSSEDSEEGRVLREALEKGQLADDKIVAKIVEVELAKPQCISGFVMDGYPRRLSQLEIFDPSFDKVIYLDLTDEEATQRMLKRGREDDTPQVIKERLMLYHQETEKVLKYYADLGILLKIDASRSIEEVSSDILALLKK